MNDLRPSETTPWTVASPQWDLDIANNPALRDLIDTASQGGAKRLLIDLSHVSFIQSSALGIFVTLQRVLKAQGGEIAFAGVGSNIQRVFEITRTESFFRFFPDVAAAEAAD